MAPKDGIRGDSPYIYNLQMNSCDEWGRLVSATYVTQARVPARSSVADLNCQMGFVDKISQYRLAHAPHLPFFCSVTGL
jgi:hypothetical protein